MAHIFGIPHSLREIAGGLIEGLGARFGGILPALQQQLPPPAVIADRSFLGQSTSLRQGFGPLDSSMEIFGEAWGLAKDLNVSSFGGAPMGNGVTAPGGVMDNLLVACKPRCKQLIVTYDETTGQCVVKERKSRKRRRRLASLSDIKDLAALKQVLGGGKAFDTWIATRGR